MDGQLQFESYLVKKVEEALKKAVKEGKFPEFEIPIINIEIPKEEKNGDYSVNTAMQLARTLKMNPRAIAEVIKENITDDENIIEKVDIAGAGFINFYLKPVAFTNQVTIINDKKDMYGKIVSNDPKSINIEYVSANPTGPLHLGNARGGCVGSVMSAVFRWAGYNVSEEYYLNDAGNQIVKFGHSLSSRYMQIFDESYPFPEDGYKGEDITVLAKEYYEENGDSLKEVSEDERGTILANYGLKKNTAVIKKALDRYGIEYDTWFSESTLHESGAVLDVIEKLRQKGATYEKDGATWFKGTDYGLEKDEVLIRNNSIPTYYAADIAYHYNKFVTRGFDYAINVWGADHHGHVQRVKTALDALGIDSTHLTIILMQLVHLMNGEEAVRLSKRSGNIITLDELLDDVGLDAARYIFNDTAPSTHMNFDLDLAVKQSNENPVFYVQYAHARMKSILRNLSIPNEDPDMSVLTEKQEVELMKKLTEFPKMIVECAKTFDPSKVTKYAFDLASAFHSFYNSCRCNVEDENLRSARLKLVTACATVLKNALDVLGISAPEQM